MATKWDALFGEKLFIRITNEERKYLALDPIHDTWEVTQFYSKTNLYHKRTSLFWEGDNIVKVIYEEKKISNEGKLLLDSIREYDANIKTNNREFIYPLTARGKMKKVTPTNVLDVSFSGCNFYFQRDYHNEKSPVFMNIISGKNSKNLIMGEWDRQNKIYNDADFHEFMNYYMKTCPTDYFERISALKNADHVTVKYKTGDIFRFEIDRFRYGYGIIMGKVSKVLEWKELPEKHTFRTLMTVPIMVRYYEIITENKNFSVEELSQIPLGRMNVCADGDIIRGICDIVGHKELEEKDIEFNLICSKQNSENTHFTTTSQHALMDYGIIKTPEKYNLYVEWGTAATTLLYENMTVKLKEYMENLRSIHGGVSLSVGYHAIILAKQGEEAYNYKNDLLNPPNDKVRQELFSCLGLSRNAGFDDFALKFGGLTIKEILERFKFYCYN